MGKGSSKLPDAGEIPAGLDGELLQQLPSELQTKLIDQYKEYKSQYDELQSSHERLRVDSEQRYFELERNFLDSNERLEKETSSAQQLRQLVEGLEQKLKDSAALIEKLQKKSDDAETTMRELETTRCSVEVQKGDLTQALESKNHEIDRLKDEWKEMADKVAKTKKECIEATAQKDQAETRVVSIQHREQRLQQENGLLQQQNDWLDQELKAKVNDLLNVRRDQSSRMLELEAGIEQRTEEISHLEELIKTLKETNEEQSSKIESYCEKLRESRDLQTQQEEQHRTHVYSQSKLINLYQSSATDAEAHAAELSSAVAELQKILKEATEAYRELQKEKEDSINEHLETIRTKDEDIERMTKELQHANELLEVARKKGSMFLSDDAIEALSPSAAAASRLLKSGMTLTQIYSEYVKASEQLLMEQQENERLQQYLDKILEEIEEKAPLMKKQREDYEKSIMAIDQLTRQLDSARCEEEKLRVESDDGRRKVMHFSRENQRLRQQTVDLGQQVRMLLKELEEARGRVVSSDVTMDLDVSIPEVSSSSHVISEKLVTFKGIEDLQKKNQELIAALRSLSDEREELEKTAMDARTAELKRKVESVSEELTMMRAARDRQVTMVASLVRQRDMYRVLLSESGSTPLPATPTPQTSTPRPAQQTPEPPTPEKPAPKSPDKSQEQLAEKTAALKELMEEFNQYREEKNKNHTMLTEQIESFRKDLSDHRVQNAQLASQLDFGAERTKVLQNNAKSYQKEIAALRDKNQKYAASVIRHEQTINSLKEDLTGVNERLSRAEVVADSLRVERNMLKSVESRLLQEKENSLREQSSQKLLLANLQAIQNNLERSDFENKTRLNQRIEMLEKENARLKSRLDGIDSQHRSILATLERQLADIQNESERRLKDLQAAKKALEVAEGKAQEAIKQLQEVLPELEKAKAAAASVPKVQTESNEQDKNIADEEVKHFRNQLEAAKAQITSLKSQLEQARQHTEQYKTMASSMELSLKEQTETSSKFKETAEIKLKETREANERTEKQLVQAEKDRQNLINENFKLTENYHKTNAELQKQLQILQSELEEAMTLRETAISNEQAARSDHSNQARLAQEAQDKYERELIVHAADVEALTNVKQQLEGFNEQLAAAESGATEAKAALDAAKSGWADQEKLYKDEESRLKTRLTDLQDQNRMLHEEIEAMSEQVMTIQHRREQEHMELSTLAEKVTTDASSERSSDQLVEVIRFLRKEKEIAEARLEVIQSESTRLKQRSEYLERQLNEANASLTEERQNTQVNLATAAQQMEMMRKVDNLNIVTESNKLLRGERDQLATELREMEAKAKKLESDITPLQASQRETATERDMLATEKVALTAEVDRWRARTNHLIEQCNKTDPEEHKRLLAEREVLRKQVATVTEDTHSLRADISRLNANIAKLDGELTSQKQKNDELKTAHANLAVQLEKKNKEAEEKTSVVLQLRRVGRKYKLQVEQITDECNKLKAELEKGAGGNMAALEEKLKKTESELEAVTEKLGSADFEKNEATKASKEAENQSKVLQEALDKATEEVKKVSESAGKLEAENKTLQEQITKLNEDVKRLKETEAKQQHLRNTIATAKTKILSQKDQIEKLTAECNEQKQKIATLQQSSGEANAKKAACESRIGTLERELAQVRNSYAAAQNDSQQIAQLQQKINVLQKQLESQQKPQQAATPKPKVSASPVPGHRHTGPKANIPPMATVTIQPFPVQPVRRTVAPTPPTATVMPTSLSAPEGELPSPSSQVRPTPPVQTVSPHIEPETQAPTERAESEEADVPQEPTPSTSTGRETGPSGSAQPHGATKRARDGTEGSDTEQEGPVKRPKTVASQVQERTELEAPANVQEVAALEQEVDVEAQRSQQQEDSSAQKEVGVVEPATQQVTPAAQQETPSTSTSAVAEQKAAAPGASYQQDTVIVLDDDDEEEEEEGEDDEGKGEDESTQDVYDEEGEEEDEEGGADADYGDVDPEDEDDEPVDEDEEDFEEQDVDDYQDVDNEDGEGMDQDYNSEDIEMSEEEGEGNQDIVIVDDDESNDAPMEPQEEEQQPLADQPLSTRERPQVAPRLRVPRMQPRTDPSTSTQPFHITTQVSQYEEGDESIVPSTPTLVIPKGTDQAISSPQVPQSRFSFSTGLPPDPPSTAQSDLASQGGVDDTRMDLSQFDDAAGRSMPSTPRSRTPPTISITEAPPQEEDGDGAATADASGGPQETETAQQSATSAAEERTTATESVDSENVPESREVEESKQEGRAETPTPSTSQEGLMEEGPGESSQTEESDSNQASDDRPGQSAEQSEKHESGAVKPKKIQRIVWDQPSTRRTGRGPRGARGMPAMRGQPIQRLTGSPAANFGQQQQQQQQQQSPQVIGRGGVQRGRAIRGQRGRRARPF